MTKRVPIDVVVEGTVSSYAMGTTVRHGRVVGFGESQGRGRATHGDVDDAGNVTFGVEGVPPKGEEGTCETCRILVSVLNSEEPKWLEPFDPKRPLIDCRCDAVPPGVGILDIQVVRAIIDPSHWKELDRNGRVARGSVAPREIADRLRKAIEHKSGVDPAARPTIVLALSALDCPQMALDVVVDAFRASHGAWAATQGFQAIWLVGPSREMTHRLDREQA